MTTVLLAPDKFKGSLPAERVAAALALGISDAAPHWRCVLAPIADGGDGTVAAAVAAGWDRVSAETTGPTGSPLTGEYARRGDAAVVELASCVGLDRLPHGRPDALGATTFGLGTVLAHALDHSAREVVIGLGGSASTDGGAGMLAALGVAILDAHGDPVGPGGAELRRAARVDLSRLHPAVHDTRFTLANDVDNPLLGSTGAAAVYGPQKGATAPEVVLLERALTIWADVVGAAAGRDERWTPGGGAAGGTAFGAITLLGARPRSGIELMLEIVGFAAKLRSADLVVTGEGSLDAQSLRGKAPVGVAAAARAAGIPVLAVAGRNALTAADLAGAGIRRAFALSDLEPDPATSIANAAHLLRRVGRVIADGEFSRA